VGWGGVWGGGGWGVGISFFLSCGFPGLFGLVGGVFLFFGGGGGGVFFWLEVLEHFAFGGGLWGGGGLGVLCVRLGTRRRKARLCFC